MPPEGVSWGLMRTILILALAPLLVLGACTRDPRDDSGGRLQVVASFYPLAEAARQVGGEFVEVRDLTPPGVEPHDLELTTDQVDALLDADLVLTIEGLQPAVDDALEEAEVHALRFVPSGADSLPSGEDPHFWLDPYEWSTVGHGIAPELAELDPDHARDFDREAHLYRRDLEALDQEYMKVLADCDRDLLVTAHDAFGRLAARYGLRVESIAGISPEAEPSPARLDELTELVEREGVTTILTEELVSPEVAETLARETGVKTAVLNPIESLTDEQRAAGEDYLSLMETNLDALSEALGCR